MNALEQIIYDLDLDEGMVIQRLQKDGLITVNRARDVEVDYAETLAAVVMDILKS